MLLALTAAWVLSTTPPSPASSPDDAPALVSWKRALCIYSGCFLEPLIPDLRYDFGDDSSFPQLILSWPIHPLPTPYFDLGPLTFHVSPFLEPQWGPRNRHFGILLGTRVSLFPGTLPVGVVTEVAGGASFRRASGWVVGGGLTWDLIERHRGTFPWTISILLRRTAARAYERYDVSFDVTVPLALPFGWRPWGESGSSSP